MYITAGKDQPASWDAGAGQLDGASVGASAGENFALCRNFGFLGNAFHPGNQFWVSQHLALLDLDRRSFSQGDIAPDRVGRIAGRRDIDYDANFRIDAIG